jgi:IMP dehydrogenase/GMP reductase
MAVNLGSKGQSDMDESSDSSDSQYMSDMAVIIKQKSGIADQTTPPLRPKIKKQANKKQRSSHSGFAAMKNKFFAGGNIQIINKNCIAEEREITKDNLKTTGSTQDTAMATVAHKKAMAEKKASAGVAIFEDSDSDEFANENTVTNPVSPIFSQMENAMNDLMGDIETQHRAITIRELNLHPQAVRLFGYMIPLDSRAFTEDLTDLNRLEDMGI